MEIKYKINFGDEVTPNETTYSFNPSETLVVICIERGAPVSPYYCWSEKRKVGEWLSEKQLQKYYGTVGSEAYWRKIKAMHTIQKH